jgi:hypothetical protein
MMRRYRPFNGIGLIVVALLLQLEQKLQAKLQLA